MKKDYFRPRDLNCRLVLRRQVRARLDMCVNLYVRLIEDAEAKLQKAFELRSFDEVAKLRREIDNYRAMLEREPKITALPRQAGKSVFDAMALLSDGVSKHLSVGIDEAFRQRLNKKLGAIELNATLAQRQLVGRGENWARRALYSISLLRGELAALREDIKDVSNG